MASGKGAPGRVWALVGDAAFGLPFFRALNDGMLCATKLATTMAAHFDPRKSQGDDGDIVIPRHVAAPRKKVKASKLSGSMSLATSAAGAGDTPLADYAAYFSSLTWRERVAVGSKASVVGSAVATANASRHMKQAKRRNVRRVKGATKSASRAVAASAATSHATSSSLAKEAPTGSSGSGSHASSGKGDKRGGSSCAVM